MKTKKEKLDVHDVPNGWTMNVNGHEFMYFSKPDLVAGFLARFGAGLTEDMERGSILNSLFNIMLGERYAKEIDRLNDTVARLQTKYNERLEQMGGELNVMREAIAKHKEMKKNVKEIAEMTSKLKDGYKEACSKYTEYQRRITQLEHDTNDMEVHFKTATKQAGTLLSQIKKKHEKVCKDADKLEAKSDMLTERILRQLNRGKDVLKDAQKEPKEATETPVGREKKAVKDDCKDGDEKAVKTAKKIASKKNNNRKVADAYVQKMADEQKEADVKKKLEEYWKGWD